jgi:hypothetical protein
MAFSIILVDITTIYDSSPFGGHNDELGYLVDF